MSEAQEWVGVDLDGTLAVYDHWRGADHIGEPIGPMVAQVKWLLGVGEDVRIMTARMSPEAHAANGEDADTVRRRIEAWCLEHIGQVLPVTHRKDFQMKILYDDRCVQILKNVGLRADGKPHDYEEI